MHKHLSQPIIQTLYHTKIVSYSSFVVKESISLKIHSYYKAHM